MSSTSENKHHVLVVDDEADIRESLRLLLKSEGFVVTLASNPEAAVAAVGEHECHVVLADLNFSRDLTAGEEGIELIIRLQSLDSTLPVVVMTAFGSVDVAVKAIRSGARDFVEKPWSNDRLVSILRTQSQLCRALRRGQRLQAENRLLRQADAEPLIASSTAMQPVLELIEKVGPSDANVLITGQHGTGKDVVARQLHAVSPRAARPMITVNVGGLSDGVFASELFGHVRGAFTDAKGDRTGRFELADRGTLFLDEIANVPFSQQAKLLRVLESGELERVGSSSTKKVDVRIISATNADLQEEITTGRFREDLYFRLNTVPIHLPPLCERDGDIPLLAMHFLGRFSQRYRKELVGFDEAALSVMSAYPWPGNVRELSHAVERAALMASEQTIKAEDLGLAAPRQGTIAALETMTLAEVERLVVDKAMRRFAGNVSRAAKALGVSRSALYRRLEKLGL